MEEVSISYVAVFLFNGVCFRLEYGKTFKVCYLHIPSVASGRAATVSTISECYIVSRIMVIPSIAVCIAEISYIILVHAL